MTQVTGGQKTTAVIQPDDISYKETGLSEEGRKRNVQNVRDERDESRITCGL